MGRKYDNRTDVTIPMEQRMKDKIELQLTYGDSVTEWVQDAIEQKLEEDDS